MIQSIIFDKKYWTIKKAHYWLFNHQLNPIKDVHETDYYYRFRINEPQKNKSYKTIKIDTGIDIISMK